MSKTLKIIFTLSLLLNLVLVGTGIGYSHKYMRKMPLHFSEMKKDISPEAQAVMKTHFDEGKEEFITMMREARQKKKVISNILQAREFDEQAYDTAVADMLETKARIEARKAERMKQMFTSLPSADRQKMAQNYAKRMEEKGHKYRQKYDKYYGDKEIK